MADEYRPLWWRPWMDAEQDLGLRREPMQKGKARLVEDGEGLEQAQGRKASPRPKRRPKGKELAELLG
jgi:hypothetical protein